MEKILLGTCYIITGLIALKAIIGYHFPWEKCECCGRKYKDHNKNNEVD
jgi:hypothetical protein